MSVNRIAQVPQTRRRILTSLKRGGPSTISVLSGRLEISGEAVRQQLIQLQRDGWVRATIERSDRSGKSGRPATRASITGAGEHLFPKRYDSLALELMDAIETEFGPARLGRVLGALAEEVVRRWLPRMRGKPIEERVQLLKSIYFEEDPFVEVEIDEDDHGYRIVERNCPFLNVAVKRPAVCSITVHAFSRLLGCRVIREKRFQHGAGHCSFRVLPGEKIEGAQEEFRVEEPVA